MESPMEVVPSVDPAIKEDEKRSFHRFRELPDKLRFKIWEILLANAQIPSVHYFSFSTSSTNGVEGYAENCPYGEQKGLSSYTALGPPSALTSDTGEYRLKSLKSFSWSKNNPSAYLIYSGLWRACKESRQVISEYFDNEWVSELVSLPTEIIAEDTWVLMEDGTLMVRDTVAFMDKDKGYTDADKDDFVQTYFPQGEDPFALCRIIMKPSQDLICLTNVSCHSGGHMQVTYPPNWYSADGDDLNGFTGLCHVAVTYIDSWDKMANYLTDRKATDDERDIDLHIGYSFGSLEGPKYMWFIDYRIQITRGEVALLEQAGRRVFNGLGHKLVEIRLPTQGDGAIASGETALAFAAAIVANPHPYQFYREDRPFVRRFGILACLKQ